MKRILLTILALLSFNAFSLDKVVLTDTNTVILNEVVSSQSVTRVMTEIQNLNGILEDKSPINLVLYTPGGSVFDGLALIRFLKQSRRPVNTITIFAASMGFQIVEANPGERLVAEGSTIMSHRAAVDGIGGQFPGELNTRVDMLMAITESIDAGVVARTNGKQTKESYAKLIQNEYYGLPNRAIADGFADKEVQIVCDGTLNSTTDRTYMTVFGPIHVEFSKCPLITSPVAVHFGDSSLNEKHSAFEEFTRTFQFRK